MKKRQWTKHEENVLMRYVQARPQNLRRCFIAVAEQINRTPEAVSAHWYGVLVKDPCNNLLLLGEEPKRESWWKKIIKFFSF